MRTKQGLMNYGFSGAYLGPILGGGGIGLHDEIGLQPQLTKFGELLSFMGDNDLEIGLWSINHVAGSINWGVLFLLMSSQ